MPMSCVSARWAERGLMQWRPGEGRMAVERCHTRPSVHIRTREQQNMWQATRPLLHDNIMSMFRSLGNVTILVLGDISYHQTMRCWQMVHTHTRQSSNGIQCCKGIWKYIRSRPLKNACEKPEVPKDTNKASRPPHIWLTTPTLQKCNAIRIRNWLGTEGEWYVRWMD